MRALLAPDKFKSCLSAAQVCDAIASGLRRGDPGLEVDSCPLSDGGEGFVDAMVRAIGGRIISVRVTGPLPEMKVDAQIGLADRTAFIEMSSASGLHLLAPNQYNPLATTTFGTGELINQAIDAGATRIVLGIGGSATCDGGIGCAQACGIPVVLDDSEPTSMTEPLCGRDVERVALIKTHRGDKLGAVQLIVACDVTNPLFGANGAARIFGPQKGATPSMIERLDRALERLARRCSKLDEASAPGAGAAGGLGFGLLAFFGARIQSGSKLVIDATDFRRRLDKSDLCITGEGSFDATSLSGKITGTVIELCHAAGKRCIVIAGKILAPTPHAELVALDNDSISTQDSIRLAPELIAQAATRAIMR